MRKLSFLLGLILLFGCARARPLADMPLFDTNTLKCPYHYDQTLRQEAPVYQDPTSGVYIVATYDLVREAHYWADSAGHDLVTVDDVERAVRETVGSSEDLEDELRWLLAGAGAAVGGDSSIWLLNTSPQAATVTLQPLGDRQLPADKVRVEPNTLRRVRLTSSPGVGGYRGIPQSGAMTVPAGRLVFFGTTTIPTKT